MSNDSVIAHIFREIDYGIERKLSRVVSFTFEKDYAIKEEAINELKRRGAIAVAIRSVYEGTEDKPVKGIWFLVEGTDYENIRKKYFSFVDDVENQGVTVKFDAKSSSLNIDGEILKLHRNRKPAKFCKLFFSAALTKKWGIDEIYTLWDTQAEFVGVSDSAWKNVYALVNDLNARIAENIGLKGFFVCTTGKQGRVFINPAHLGKV